DSLCTRKTGSVGSRLLRERAVFRDRLGQQWERSRRWNEAIFSARPISHRGSLQSGSPEPLWCRTERPPSRAIAKASTGITKLFTAAVSRRSCHTVHFTRSLAQLICMRGALIQGNQLEA